MKAMALVARNHLVAISGSSMFKLLTSRRQVGLIQPDLERDRATWFDLPVQWDGTAVGIDLQLTDDQAFRDLLRIIGQVYGQDVGSPWSSMPVRSGETRTPPPEYGSVS
jgi:hypothetical protein